MRKMAKNGEKWKSSYGTPYLKKTFFWVQKVSKLYFRFYGLISREF